MKDISLVSSLMMYTAPDILLWACKLPGQVYISIIGMHFYLMVPTQLGWGGPLTDITYRGAQWFYSVGSYLTPLILVYACLIVIGLVVVSINKRIESHD